MTDSTAELTRLRAAIDDADRKLIAALDARADAVRALATGAAHAPQNYAPMPRVTDVIAKARELATVFPKSSLDALLREVVYGCESIVKPIHIAYLGTSGGLGNLAARNLFGASAVLAPRDSATEVLRPVAAGEASFGVLLYETSADGAMTSTLEALALSDLQITSEIVVPASYHLYSKAASAADIDRVYAVPAAHAACDRHIRAQFPKAKYVDVLSAFEGAEKCLASEKSAVISNETVAEKFGLQAISSHMEDETEVTRRYVVVGKEPSARTGKDLTILAFATHDEAGALHKALKPFADRKVNLTRLESRPLRSVAWRHVFFVELEGHVTDRSVVMAMEDLRESTRWLKVLGSYPV